MPAAEVGSRGMRTGSPPASVTARSYCGMARSAYSRSSECGMGMAMRTAMRSAHPLDGRQSLSLATVTNFHDDCQHKNDYTSHQGHRQGKLAIRNGHIGMQAAYSRYDDGTDNSQ